MCIPHHWPLETLRLLEGGGRRLVLWFTRAPTAIARGREQVLLHMHDVHLLQTPEYRPVLAWFAEESPEPIETPRGVFRHRADRLIEDASRTAYTRAEWFALHPRREQESMWLAAVHRDDVCLAHAEHHPEVRFCLADAASPSEKRRTPDDGQRTQGKKRTRDHRLSADEARRTK